MSSKRCVRRSACGEKRRYECIAAANSAAWRARVKTGDVIKSYKYPFCNKWHIGHRKGGRKWRPTIK